MTKIASESQDSPSHEGSSRDCVQRTDSALRSSIAKYGSNSVSSTPMLSLRNVEVRVRPIDSSAPSSATHVGIGGGSLSSLCCTAAQYYYAHAKSPEEKGAVKVLSDSSESQKLRCVARTAVRSRGGRELRRLLDCECRMTLFAED